MSFYGIESGLSSFFAGADMRPEDRAVVAKRVADRLRQLRDAGVFVGLDDADLDHTGLDHTGLDHGEHELSKSTVPKT